MTVFLQKVLQRMSSLTSPIELKRIDNGTVKLVNGFIRNTQRIMQLTLPEPIHLIIIEYYDVSFRFNICLNKDLLKNDGKIFHSYSNNKLYRHNINAGCLNGAKIGNFKFKINKCDFLGVGITSDISNCASIQWMYNYSAGITYYVYHESSKYASGWTAKGSKAFSTASKLKSGDPMRIEWDSNQGIFEYYRNNEKEGSMKIAQGLIYYPCVCRMWDAKDVEIEILD